MKKMICYTFLITFLTLVIIPVYINNIYAKKQAGFAVEAGNINNYNDIAEAKDLNNENSEFFISDSDREFLFNGNSPEQETFGLFNNEKTNNEATKSNNKDKFFNGDLNYKAENKETLQKNEVSFNIADNLSDIESYIVGVVAAEMPAGFEKEALKAQAVAARTYTVRKFDEDINNTIKNEDGSYSLYQAYITIPQMKKNWGGNFESNYKKVVEAVKETEGEIMIYDDEPILAVFHSTSAGMTEASENVWGGSLPYLKSTDSEGDKLAPNFISEKKFENSELLKVFRENYTDIKLTNTDILKQMQITKRTNAGYITEMQVGNKSISGSKIREILGLRSVNFTIEKDKNGLIVFKTKGYGHGAGMSQYGAEYMAKNGSDYKEILNHYYKDISFKKLNK